MSATLNIVSKYDGRGVRAAGKDLKGLEKSAIFTKARVSAALAAIAVAAKVSADAFIADEKAAAQLAATLRNFGKGEWIAQNEKFIASLQTSTGILDDELRPAMLRLFTATQDVGIAQKLMQKAVDISAGTGKDLQTVTEALSKALQGNRRGLLSLGTNLDAATIKSGKLSTVFDKLSKYDGSNLAQVGTKARALADAKVLWENAKETFGSFVTDIVMWGYRGIAFTGDRIIEVIDKIRRKVPELPSSHMEWGVRLGWKASRPEMPGAKKAKAKTLADYFAELDRKAGKSALDSQKKLNAEKAKTVKLSRLAAKYDLELIGLSAAARNNRGNTGILGRISDLTTIATANAGLPVSASALAGARNTQIPPVIVHVQGSVITERDLLDTIQRQMLNVTLSNTSDRSGGWL